MGTSIYLKSKNQSEMENTLRTKNLTCNWSRCHPHDQYYVLKILTGYCPSIPQRGEINNLEIIKEMKNCVEFFLQCKEVPPDSKLPKYGKLLDEMGAVHIHKRILNAIPDITIIASKLYDWLDIGIKYESSICVI
jgi:hypothetical protein